MANERSISEVRLARAEITIGKCQFSSRNAVNPTTRPQATATENLVYRLRDDVLSKEHATSYVTGTTAGTVDFTERITGRMVWLILAVVVISFILLATAFRSVVIATKAAILNLLSIGAVYGVIVAIFQY
jgi:putative drug exporter of the RND superfamily